MDRQEKKIGKVTISIPKKKSIDDYQDKGTEDLLLELFRDSSDPEKERDKILDNNPSWPMLYHLTRTRANLLGWYDFPDNSSVLEIGAGCGGVTESLVKNKKISVTALELAEKRALINAHRNNKHENLKIVVDNLENYQVDKKFDYVICVGVLEYAGRYIRNDNPYEHFLKLLSGLVKPGGKLLLAIENRFGLKYWSGAKEDHVHTHFAGHNGYPGKLKMRTFGRKELSDLLINSGFDSTYFFYPYPDYKTPSIIYSDDYYPGNGATFPLSRLSTPTFDRPRESFFSEQSAMRFIELNDLFPDLSNSFLVEATSK